STGERDLAGVPRQRVRASREHDAGLAPGDHRHQHGRDTLVRRVGKPARRVQRSGQTRPDLVGRVHWSTIVAAVPSFADRSHAEALPMEKVDVFVIGGGGTGSDVTYALAGAGLNVVMAEREVLGGECAN